MLLDFITSSQTDLIILKTLFNKNKQTKKLNLNVTLSEKVFFRVDLGIINLIGNWKLLDSLLNFKKSYIEDG